MPKVFVYRFEVFDPESGAWNQAPHFATREHIDSREGAVILNTKLEIDSSSLTPAGTYASARKPWPG